MAFYYQHLTANDPLWKSLLSQYANAGVWTPPHIHLVILMGLPLLLAFLSYRIVREGDERLAFVGTWAVVGLGLIYLPVVFQIKLLTGLQLPLAILAAYTWHDRLVPWLASNGRLG